MLSTNALNFAIQTDAFKKHISSKGLNADAVNSILIKHLISVEYGHVYKISFDYGLVGSSDKDLVLTVKIIDENSFKLIQE